MVDAEIRSRRRSGEIVRLCRGAYLLGDERQAEHEARHALLVGAEARRVASTAVVSHVSAAVLHGLPVWGVGLDRVHVTRARPTGARKGPSVRVHSAPLTAAEVVEVHGIPVTSPARTVVDLARRSPFASGVATGDAALRARLVTLDELDDALRRVTGWPGAPAARRVVSFLDGRSESVGESRSRVAIWLSGLPPPTPQWEVWHRGRMLGRVDFAWPDQRLVAEFDGRLKYGRLLRPGQDPGELVYQEKLREDAIRAAGFTVVRWTWRSLDDFTPHAARLRDHLATR